MAKIALISQSLSPELLTMGQGLQGQQHEVFIITSHQEELPKNFDFQVLTYFRRWSAIEAFRLLPHLLGNIPDVFHFFYQQENEKPTAAHWVLLSVAQGLRKAVVVSLGEAKMKLQTWRLNPFLKMARAVIVPTREKLMFLRRKDLLGPQVLSEVILPLPSSVPAPAGEERDLKQLLQNWRPFVLVPAHPNKELVDQLTAELKTNGHRLVFLGARSDKIFSDLRCLVFDSLSESEIHQLVESSSALVLAFHQFEASELLRWQSLARRFQRPLIVKSRQLEMVPGLCNHGRNGFLVQNTDTDFHRLLQQFPNFEISNWESTPSVESPADHSLNEINRLYVRALSGSR